MEAIDPSMINTQSTIGQVTVLIIALVSLFTAIRPALNFKSGSSKRKYDTIVDELKAVKKDLEFSRTINRNLVEWQISARELIRVLRIALADSGVEAPKSVEVLTAFLEKIESEDLYSELEVRNED